MRMNPDQKRKAKGLARAVAVLQLKLLLGAARDLVLIPLALIAALFDLVRLKSTEPRYFRQVLQFGEHTDRWIDVWYANHDDKAEPRENVDALLRRVEEVVRDPQRGGREARVLKRWAERQIQQAKERTTQQIAARQNTQDSDPPLPPPEPPPAA
jgi:hypothetical protein